jgi:uncharacterized protein (DUF1501 family)
MTRSPVTRRHVLEGAAGMAGALALPGLLATRLSFAAATGGDARFVLVLLRGALDGLAAAPPVGDPAYAGARGALTLEPGAGLLRLDDLFALHPALSFMGEQWQQKHMTLLHAVATPYRERSHFDAQDVLESGRARPHASQSGWLNRALAGLPQARGRPVSAQQGVALGAGVPLVMRGPAEVASWSPSRLPPLDEDTLQRLGDLYAHDELLARRLAEATAAQDMAGDAQGMGGARSPLAQFGQAAKSAAGFLLREEGPRVAVLESSGWDTHANQGAQQGALAARLAALDSGLRTLHADLGAAWSRTVVLVATEFGRTVAMNGTRGTDHGVGAAAFLVGGAVRGRVLADWPGLAAANLYQGRDLAPTLDLRAVMAAVLRDHLGIAPAFIEREVFPDGGLARVDGLFGD